VDICLIYLFLASQIFTPRFGEYISCALMFLGWGSFLVCFTGVVYKKRRLNNERIENNLENPSHNQRVLFILVVWYISHDEYIRLEYMYSRLK